MTHIKNLGLKYQPAPSNITNSEQMSNNQIKKSEEASSISIVTKSIDILDPETIAQLDLEKFYVEEKSEVEIASSDFRRFLDKCLKNDCLSSSISLTQTETEQFEVISVEKKAWKGKVSLDSGKYNNKPQKDDVGHINNGIANGATKVGELQLIEAITLAA